MKQDETGSTKQQAQARRGSQLEEEKASQQHNKMIQQINNDIVSREASVSEPADLKRKTSQVKDHKMLSESNSHANAASVSKYRAQVAEYSQSRLPGTKYGKEKEVSLQK